MISAPTVAVSLTLTLALSLTLTLIRDTVSRPQSSQGFCGIPEQPRHLHRRADLRDDPGAVEPDHAHVDEHGGHEHAAQLPQHRGAAARRPRLQRRRRPLRTGLQVRTLWLRFLHVKIRIAMGWN